MTPQPLHDVCCIVLLVLSQLISPRHCYSAEHDITYLLPAPMNVSVTDGVTDKGFNGEVCVSWILEEPHESSGVEITVTQMDSPLMRDGFKTFIVQVDPSVTEYTVTSLKESTNYVLYITTYKLGTHSEPSERLYFTTRQGDASVSHPLFVAPLDAVIVFSVLVAWILSFALFVHKWSKIRICRSAITRIKPKNLENIKVVKSSTDSVIRRSYSTNYNKTLAAREKRIARMRTMPEFKLDFLPPANGDGKQSKSSKPGRRQRSMSLPYFDKTMKFVKPAKALADLPLMRVTEEEETDVDKLQDGEEAEECLLPGFV